MRVFETVAKRALDSGCLKIRNMCNGRKQDLPLYCGFMEIVSVSQPEILQ